MNNYTVTHLHSMFSNGTTNIDSVNSYEQYILYAKKCGMKAIAFTEHGNIYGWVKKKDFCEENGLKYIHGVEIYITKNLTQKIRDNHHTCLYAKNYEGVKEINRLVSRAGDRDDGHYYYVPRITLDEFLGISDNVIVSTACLGSVLNSDDIEFKKRYIEYLQKNKHRCFLEIQHHNVEEQKDYNVRMLKLHKQYGIPLICGTDTHCLNEDYSMGRHILKKAKKIQFSNEDDVDLTFKTYDELIDCYKQQNSIDMDYVYEAINNTNVLADMVETFSLDRNPKYPKLYEDSSKVFKQKINEGVKWRGINKLQNYKDYIQRIRYENEVYESNGAVDFMLLEEDYKAEMRKRGVLCGYSRGSCSGSVIAYTLGVTEIDSIKHKLNFERFMNKERVSLADIDTDWYSEDRETVKDYLYNKKGLYCCDIITFNTIADKGAIRDVGRALEIDLSIIDEICKTLETQEDYYREKYPELFKYVDMLKGVIVSVGNHPAGVVVSPYPVDEWFGTFTSKSSKYPISQINMKEIDSLKFVKLDILGLDNVGIINKTCELAGIERLTPNNTDANDIEVWKSIREDTLGIFQWESDSASAYLKQLLSDETIERIKQNNPNFSYIDILSIGNGAIRPAGESYRDNLSKGIFKDHGHEALNEFLSPTLGYLVFQEQIIEFLHKFCGYTMGEADIVRRAFSKKGDTSEYIDIIKNGGYMDKDKKHYIKGFIQVMKEQYGTSEQESEKLIESFVQVIIDASDYLFSLNHSDPYSWIGYICGYLRYHYPLQFLTSLFNINQNDMDKTERIYDYCVKHKINILSPKFGYSRAEYYFDTDTNSIYKGITSIKYLNSNVAEKLYELSKQVDKDITFYELLKKIDFLDNRQLDILIKLGYFSMFGSSYKLLKIVELKNKFLSRKTFKADDPNFSIIKKFSGKVTEKQCKDVNVDALMNFFIDKIQDIELSPKQMIAYEHEYTGSPYTTDKNYNPKHAIVLDINTKYTPTIQLYQICSGKVIEAKVKTKFLNENYIGLYDEICVTNTKKQYVKRKIDGEWITTKDFYYYVEYTVV